MRHGPLLTALTGGALFLPTALEAQVLHGRLLEAGTHEPIAGGFVLLLPDMPDTTAAPLETPDTTAIVLDVALTGPDGEFVLTAPRAGRYRVRVDRIGYRSQLAETFEIGREATAVTIAVPVEPVELPLLTAEVEPECETDPRESQRLAIVWEEVRKALAAAVWAESRGIFRFTARTYARVENARGRELDERSVMRSGLRRDSPYVSLPVEELAAEGYVRSGRDSLDFYAPDARALLSDPFLRDHCFRLIGGRSIREPGWLGLAFEPVATRRRPDVEGVLWIDRASSELRRLEFEFTGLPWYLARHDPSGRVEFERAPNGAWIVRRWRMRVPAVEEQRGRRVTRHVLKGWMETGGEVSNVEAVDEEAEPEGTDA